jgi:hypothetical protein
MFLPQKENAVTGKEGKRPVDPLFLAGPVPGNLSTGTDLSFFLAVYPFASYFQGIIICRSPMDFFIRDSMQPDGMSGTILQTDLRNMPMHFDIIIMHSLIGFIMEESMHIASGHEASMHFVFMQMLSMHFAIIIMQVLMDFIMAASMDFASMHLGIIIMQSHMDFIMGAIICIMPMVAISMNWFMHVDIIIMQSHMDFIMEESMLVGSMHSDIIIMQSHMDFIMAEFMHFASMHVDIIIMQSSMDFPMVLSIAGIAFMQAVIMDMQLFMDFAMAGFIGMVMGAMVMHWDMQRYIMVMQPFMDFCMALSIGMGFVECEVMHWDTHCDMMAWRSHIAFSMRMSMQFIIIDPSQQLFSILDAFIIDFM